MVEDDYGSERMPWCSACLRYHSPQDDTCAGGGRRLLSPEYRVGHRLGGILAVLFVFIVALAMMIVIAILYRCLLSVVRA